MPPRTRKKPQISVDGEPTEEAIKRALDDLAIDRPYYTCKVVGNRLEFSLYGGDVVHWPPSTSPSRRGRGRGK